jgi:hypothetical protein
MSAQLDVGRGQPPLSRIPSKRIRGFRPPLLQRGAPGDSAQNSNLVRFPPVVGSTPTAQLLRRLWRSSTRSASTVSGNTSRSVS